MPKVTVVMPAYQAAATIGRAIASVRAQTFTDWELIVVDDASTDETGKVAASHAASDPRVRVMTNLANHGASASMNRGWRGSSSPFVAILDADDVALPERLGRQFNFLSGHAEVDVLGTAAHFIDADDVFLRTVCPLDKHNGLKQLRWYVCPFVHSTVMMRRQFLEATGGYTEGLRLGEDYDLWMRGFYQGEFRYANLDEPLVIYRARPTQRWQMICASAAVRLQAGRRERRRWRGWTAAARIFLEGAVEQTGIFAWRDQIWPDPAPPDVAERVRSH